MLFVKSYLQTKIKESPATILYHRCLKTLFLTLKTMGGEFSENITGFIEEKKNPRYPKKDITTKIPSLLSTRFAVSWSDVN